MRLVIASNVSDRGGRSEASPTVFLDLAGAFSAVARCGGHAVESVASLGVSAATAMQEALRVWGQIESVPVEERPLWKAESLAGFAPFLTFKNSQLMPYVSQLSIVRYARYRLALARLIDKYGVKSIEVRQYDLPLLLALLAVPPHIKVPRWTSLWAKAGVVVDLTRVGLLFALKSAKGFARWLYGNVALWSEKKARADVLLTSYPNFVVATNERCVDVMMEPLRKELERAQKRAVLITYDYSFGFNRGLMSRRGRMVPFELYCSLWEFLLLPARAVSSALRGLYTLRELRRRWARDADLWPVLWPVVAQYYFFYAPTVQLEARATARMLATLDPSEVYLIGEYTKIGQLLIVEAAVSGRKTVGIQHGIIHDQHPGYVAQGAVQGAIGSMFALPDRFAIHGHHELDVLRVTHPQLAARSVPVGALRLDSALARSTGAGKSVTGAVGLGEGTVRHRIAVFGSVLAPEASLALIDALRRLVSVVPDCGVVIKPHPRDFAAGRRRVDMGVGDGRIVVDPTASTYDLLRDADLVLVYDSTLASEAIAIGKRVVIMYWPQFVRKRLPWADQGLAVLNSDPDELPELCASILESPPTINQAIRSDFVREHYTAMDGLTASRVARLA